MPTVTQYNPKFADAHIQEPILRRHASCPPGTLRQVNPTSDSTRLIPASATRSLLVTRDDQARTPSATNTYSASVSFPINPPDSSWVHVSTTTQAQLELGSKVKDVRTALETGSFKAVYPPGLESFNQIYTEQDSSLNAWTDPLVYGHYDDGHCYDDGYYQEHLSPIDIHKCLLLVSSDAHVTSSFPCLACNESTQEAYSDSAVDDCISKQLASMSLGKDGVDRKDKDQVSRTWDSALDMVMDRP